MNKTYFSTCAYHILESKLRYENPSETKLLEVGPDLLAEAHVESSGGKKAGQPNSAPSGCQKEQEILKLLFLMSLLSLLIANRPDRLTEEEKSPMDNRPEIGHQPPLPPMKRVEVGEKLILVDVHTASR